MFQWMKKKLSDWQFNRDRRKYAEGKFYEFSGLWTEKDGAYRDDMDRIEHGMPFSIIQGSFKGITFCFTRVAITEQGVTFQVHVLNKNRQEVKQSPVFQAVTRKILLGVLYKLYSGDQHLGFGLKPGEEYIDEDRNDNSEEPHTERTVRQKSAALSEERPI